MTDQVEKENVQIEYFPMDDMWGDFMKIRLKEKSLGALETTYLVEVNTVELVSEGHGKKCIYGHK